jgi:hypothetical protein
MRRLNDRCNIAVVSSTCEAISWSAAPAFVTRVLFRLGDFNGSRFCFMEAAIDAMSLA